MMIVPRDKDGHVLSEGQSGLSGREAWEYAALLIEGDGRIAYVSVHDATGKEENQLWRLSCYQGWAKTPED